MKLEEIKELGLKKMQHVEVRFENEAGSAESRCGWFLRIFDLPEGMKEIPAQYKHAYPVEPPFVEIGHSLERNQCPRDVVPYKPEKIYWLRGLQPVRAVPHY